MNTAALLAAGDRLVECLRAFEGDDRERGMQAAEIVERTLRLFATTPQVARTRLAYDVGGKGMLDWGWSSVHRAKLEAFSSELFALLQAPL